MSSKPLRVLVDGRMLLGRFSGVARVVTELVEHLAMRADALPILLCGNEPYLPWSGRDDVEMLVTDFSRRDRSPLRRLLWEETKLAGWVSRSKADVFHATWNSGIPRQLSIPSVLTIHDLIPWSQASAGVSGRIQRWCYRRGVSSSARRANVVTAVSDFSRDAICSTLGLTTQDVVTVHNGVSLPTDGGPSAATTQAASSGASDLPNPFVLYVGGHEPRKNLAGVFRAVRAYWRDYDKNLTLAVTGTLDALCAEARTEFEALPEGSRVRFLGFPSDDDLGVLYKDALALLMLSTNEGFGLPVLEAMSNGCPVIAADCASLPEIVGDAGVLVEPHDAGGVAGWIHRLATDTPYRSEIVAYGLARASCFSWEAACSRMMQAYQSASTNAATAGATSSQLSLATHNHY